MLGKKSRKGQMDLFRPRLDQLINPNHELSKEVDWQWIEDQLKGHYSQKGRPSVKYSYYDYGLFTFIEKDV